MKPMLDAFEVCAEKCDQCLFTPQRIVSGQRMKQILAECASKDKHFQCHKASIVGRDVCCRGFFDTQNGPPIMQISQRLGWVREVPLSELEVGDA